MWAWIWAWLIEFPIESSSITSTIAYDFTSVGRDDRTYMLGHICGSQYNTAVGHLFAEVGQHALVTGGTVGQLQFVQCGHRYQTRQSGTADARTA